MLYIQGGIFTCADNTGHSYEIINGTKAVVPYDVVVENFLHDKVPELKGKLTLSKRAFTLEQ